MVLVIRREDKYAYRRKRKWVSRQERMSPNSMQYWHYGIDSGVVDIAL